MNIAIAFVLINITWGVDPIPTKPGITWTFEKREGNEVLPEKWEVVSLPENFSGQIFEESDKGAMEPPRSFDVTAKTPGIVGINVDGNLRFLIRTLPDQQRLYTAPGWGNEYFTILFVIPRDLKAGMTWKTFRGKFSCGVLIEEFNGKAFPLTLDLFPGNGGYRLTGKNGAESATLDIVPGKGIVGMDLDVYSQKWQRTRVK